MIFSPIALLFVPLPLHPLHATQAGPQKTSQIYVLLLQVASLSDFKSVSVSIMATSALLGTFNRFYRFAQEDSVKLRLYYIARGQFVCVFFLCLYES